MAARSEGARNVKLSSFIDKVLDKESGFWYPQRDKTGSPIKGTGVTQKVKTIMRTRAKDGKQYLLSVGRLWGWDKHGDSVRIPFNCMERYKQTEFSYVKRFDPKKEEMISICQGPSGIETRYTLPFTKENVMDLYSKRDENFNTSSGFMVYDLATGGEKTVQVKALSGDMEETLKLFIESDFDYLVKGSYVPLYVKAEYRQKAIAQGLIPPGPLIVNQAGEEITAETVKPAPNTGTYS